MDLSAVIFVVLALAWAGYLIPKALKHHDEMASDRLVEAHSDRVRVLRRTRTTTAVVVDEVEGEGEVRLSRRQRRRAARREAALARPIPRPVTLRAARAAAQRRRRVLLVLLAALAVVAGLAYAGTTPLWSPAVPAALVVAFLLVARRSVRRARRAVVQRRSTSNSASTEQVPSGVVATEVVSDPSTRAATDEVDVALHGPADPADREAAALLADDGALWDPLPMTLPTYVNKARARRTVRTIELTGMQSSGHSAADTALAREAEAESAAKAQAGAEAAQRRAAGA